MFGVGATIGTGIFIVLTEAVPEAGPGIVVSFDFAGITAALTAVCYAELASTIPVSGSSYSYTYATMGEIVEFSVAACLLLEYGVSAAAVSVGWGQYLNELLFDLFGLSIPDTINAAPGEGGFFILPAIVLVMLCGLLLIRGARESATANSIQEKALDSLSWEEGEVLVVGSSRLGPVARVFLGSRTTKIVRSSPVPVLVIPRGADVRLQDAAPSARGFEKEQ
jgi:hypothetical protein